MRRTSAAACALACACVCARAAAQPWAPGLFFGTTMGVGAGWLEHPQVSEGPRAGFVWDVLAGWQLSPRWAAAAVLTSWQLTPIGTPWHLHTFGARVELAPWEARAWYFAGVLGLAMTDGDVQKRAGVGAGVTVGHRWALNGWVSLAAEGGVLAHAYSDGWAAQPFLVAHLRFHGRSEP
ncbi:MAG: hypothetical protein HY909_17450 [Deltaproteobacteria bacterium]|nr:hypothetical protein [Deltaproteobacteria bacterium]